MSAPRTRVSVVDYGLGNVLAIANIYKRLGIDVTLARDASAIEDATHLVLPGVGAFDWAMAKLDASGLRDALERRVSGHGVPVLGICVGMQMMAKRSDEGRAAGLGWIDADVRLFDAAGTAGRARPALPHMGWNDVEPTDRDDGLLRGLGERAGEPPRFYFLHSYYVAAADAADVTATTDYGGRFACAVRRGNVHGVQFHPEKSHGFGIGLLRNFAAL